MKYKTYRICLLSLVILAVVGGIFYYRNMEENQLQTVDGTFVEAFPVRTEGYMTAMGAFDNRPKNDSAGYSDNKDGSEKTMDAFCRKVAGWENYADGEAYGGR